jgi:hypothetical protein
MPLKYNDNVPGSLVLPVMSNQKMNAYLKEIADICGINKPLSFHCLRHTFATTVTLSKGVSIESVSKMLGHTNIKTTQIYAWITDNKISNDMALLAKKLEEKKMKPKSNLDILFDCLSFSEKRALFHLSATFSDEPERVKWLSEMWQKLSEEEKSSLWGNTFASKDNGISKSTLRNTAI